MTIHSSTSGASAATVFDFTGGITGATIPGGPDSPTLRQQVGADTLNVTANAGTLVRIGEDEYTGKDDPILSGHTLAVDLAIAETPTRIVLRLDAGKVFDFDALSLFDLNLSVQQLRITTNKGSITVNLPPPADPVENTTASRITLPDIPDLQGIAWAELSDVAGGPLLFQMDDIALSNITHPPQFDGPFTIRIGQNGAILDLAPLLQVTDPDLGEVLSWSAGSAPGHGSLELTGASAPAGGNAIAPGGSVHYTPHAGFAGTDSFQVRVSDGVASASATISVEVAPQMPDRLDLAAASDSGLSSSDNVTAAASLTISGQGGAGDSSSRVLVFIDRNGNARYDAGDTGVTVTMNDGAWSAAGLSTSGLDGGYDIYAQATSSDGTASSARSAPLRVEIDHMPPAIGFGSIALDHDSGTSDSDFVTNVAAQTIRATLSAALQPGDRVQGSLDNGASWLDLTAMVDGTALSWSGATLVAGGGIRLRALDQHGNAGAATARGYTLDLAAPGQQIASAALESDTNIAGDFITSVPGQTVSGTLSAALGPGEFVEVSLNGGDDWVAASASGTDWSLPGVLLPSGGTLQVRVSDQAGNHGETWSHTYCYDAGAPVAGTPVRQDMVNPAGAGFTFTVTYADSGAGIDTSSIGTGNVSVTGPAGALTVVDVSASAGPESHTVTYTVLAPGGGWDANDAGSYTIGINPGVRDLAGNTVAPNAAAHVFSVGVSSAPVLGGAFATPLIDDTDSVAPFAGVTLSEADGDAVTLTISYTAANGTLSGHAALAGGAGNYTLSGSAAAVQAALRELVFTPTANQSDGAPVATTFTLRASDGSASTSNSATVVTTAPVAPTASIVLSDTALAAGESALLTVTFSEAVTGFAASHLTLPGATLGALSSSDGGRTWTARVTPAADTPLAAHQVLLDMRAIVDAGGLAGAGAVAGPHYTVSTVRPTAALSIDDTTLGAGETATLTITFSEAVSGLDESDLTVAGGALSGLASADGGVTWTAILTPSSGAWSDANTVRLDLSGVRNGAGNSGAGVALSNPYAVHTGTAPGTGPQPEPAPEPTPGMVDGVRVTTVRATDPLTGLVNNLVTVPVVTGTRTDDPASPNDALADIPLTATRGAIASTLSVGLPVGAGLQASSPATLLTGSQALLDLISRIEQKTGAGTAAREAMSGAGSAFIEALGQGALLHSATMTPVATSGTGANAIHITGTPGAGGAATGIVIDAARLGAGTVLQLDHVDFAAVSGAITVGGGAGDNIVTGDDASQHLLMGEGDDVLLGGGGNDVLQGGRSAVGQWEFTLANDGALGARHETAVVARGAWEALALGDLDRAQAELAFLSAASGTLTETALLYHAAFGRAADIGGLNYYLSHGVGASTLARAFVASAEWAASGMNALTDGAFVQRLYRQVLDRDGEAAGLAFWNGQLSAGVATRADLLLGFALSDEHRATHAAGLVVAAGAVDTENGWIGASGDDRLEGGAGSDLLVGGDGVDTAVYAGKLADYRLLLGEDDQLRMADQANADVDILLGIERGQFSDGTVDLEFTQADTLATLGLLYQTVLDRAGDIGGLNWWSTQALDRASLVAGFIAAPEFTARYDAMSDAAFVAALYANSGLSTEAAGGSAAWTALLQEHTRAELIGSWIVNTAVLDAQYAQQGLWLV